MPGDTSVLPIQQAMPQAPRYAVVTENRLHIDLDRDNQVETWPRFIVCLPY
jgi:hypothetical protein